jgi:phage terminase large subunit
MQRLGLAPMLVRNANIEDGISAARRTLPLCLFHERCEDVGLAALEQYRRQWDDERKCYKPLAVHDWTSHPADAFRYLGLAWRSVPGRRVSSAPVIRGWVIPPPAEPRHGGIRI